MTVRGVHFIYLRHLVFILALCPLLSAQRPEVAIIDFYGVKKVPIDKLRKALGFAEGSPMPASKGETELKLNFVTGVVGAQLQAICCEAGKAIVYVGIEEKGSTHFTYRAEPEAELQVPKDVEEAYLAFLQQVTEAAKANMPEEDLTEGHSLMRYLPAREAQLKFVDLTETHGVALREVSRKAGDPAHRAMAVYVMGYAKQKFRVIDDLFYALKDMDETVRANALRALGAITVKAKLDPDAEIKVPATWFIEMLNSLSWSDRTQAARFLVNLTDSRDPRVLLQIKERAFDSIVEMAKWKHAEHSLPAYILLGRVSGFPEEDLQHAWSTGDRELMIKRALEPPKKR